MAKTWFVTGASRGFGREWTVAALERGDAVAATARNVSALAGLASKYGASLLPLQLDVTDRAAVFQAVAAAHDGLGRLDVVINNAGFGQTGMIEELREEDIRDQLETNFYGALWVVQAAVPLLRDQGGGHVIQVSSVGGVTAYPGIGAYSASKWALEGLSQSLALEVAQFGIKVTILEPALYATDVAGSSARHAPGMPIYDALRARLDERQAARIVQPGDPQATCQALLELVDLEEPPLRVFLGNGPLEVVTRDYEDRLATWRKWNQLSVEAHGHER